jgi:uncharacterized protein
MSDLHISWTEYHQKIEQLAASIHQSGWKFNQIVCLAKGDLTMTTANLGSHVLLVDDLVDSGASLKRTLVWLDRNYGFYIDEVRSAVLWYKECSAIAPDYYVDYLADNPWIHQPFEKYEQMKPEDLVPTIEGSSES